MTWEEAQASMEQGKKVKRLDWDKGVFAHVDQGHLNQCGELFITHNWKPSDEDLSATDWAEVAEDED